MAGPGGLRPGPGCVSAPLPGAGSVRLCLCGRGPRREGARPLVRGQGCMWQVPLGAQGVPPGAKVRHPSFNPAKLPRPLLLLPTPC